MKQHALILKATTFNTDQKILVRNTEYNVYQQNNVLQKLTIFHNSHELKMRKYSSLTFWFITIFMFSNVRAEYKLMSSYDITEHPYYTLDQFSGFSPPPTVMKKYFSIVPASGKPATDRVRYIPSAGSYRNVMSGEEFVTGVDVLATNDSQPLLKRDSCFLHFELRHEARIFVALGNAPRLDDRFIERILTEGEMPKITGIPSNWSSSYLLLQNSDTSGFDRMTKEFFPEYMLAFEIPVPSDLMLYLPNPRSIEVNELEMKQFNVLIMKPNENYIIPFPRSPLPPLFTSPITEEVVNASMDPPVRNSRCPEWLHDLYSVKSDTNGEDIGEPAYWRTWHPIIDPIYWCHFKHDHGSHPGKMYRPKFGYTAWKTPDETTPSGRQDESHNGFKIISFQVPGDGRTVVITAHMHLSLKRRFRERKHTVIFAVLSSEGELQAEISMKAEFGPAVVTLVTGEHIPIDYKEERVQRETDSMRMKVWRRINVINIDENYPDSVNRSYKIIKLPEDDPTDVSGNYEQWKTRLNTCVSMEKPVSGFKIDVEDPASSLRFPKLNRMSWLNGYSIRRNLVVDKFEFGPTYCEFNGSTYEDVNDRGYFYTDPYFQTTPHVQGKNLIRQFIMPDFPSLELPTGIVERIDFWDGYHSYDHMKKVFPTNIEYAIDRKEN